MSKITEQQLKALILRARYHGSLSATDTYDTNSGEVMAPAVRPTTEEERKLSREIYRSDFRDIKEPIRKLLNIVCDLRIPEKSDEPEVKQAFEPGPHIVANLLFDPGTEQTYFRVAPTSYIDVTGNTVVPLRDLREAVQASEEQIKVFADAFPEECDYAFYVKQNLEQALKHVQENGKEAELESITL